MKTRLLIGAAVVVAAIPAIIGLWGNASFSQDLPVRVPSSGQIVPLTTSPSPSATPSASDSSSPSPSPSGSVDDNGGDVPRDQRTEPGDDRDVQGGSGTTDDSGHHGGADDSGHHGGSGSDESGHGGDDDGDDDHGGSGHGSDD